MDFWLAIVLIVAMSMLSGVVIEALKTRRVVAKHGGARELEADELRQLRERVQVLERAVTDPSRRLASEIDQLRE